MITPELREYAETPDRFSAISGGGVTRYADERVCIVQGRTWASASGVRVAADDVEALVADARALVDGGKETVWSVGPSASPADLYERLSALGLEPPRDRVGVLHALVLTEEPPPAPTDVDVARVETFEQFLASREVQWDAFAVPAERRERQRPTLRDEFEESVAAGVPVGFLAMLGGRPAAQALAIPSDRGVFLVGGATASWARGRGLYRALVRARWDYAVERGTPALVTHADPATSYPILRRRGFEEVCTLRRLQDTAGKPLE